MKAEDLKGQNIKSWWETLWKKPKEQTGGPQCSGKSAGLGAKWACGQILAVSLTCVT